MEVRSMKNLGKEYTMEVSENKVLRTNLHIRWMKKVSSL